ncbi:hypothetical protein HID58_007064 [Brassica napus]|uniref:Uncharacterized protein n=1 Tax=Brassica napus TaxID=3708 RepID=A0ABQ8EDU8_BRANA|nr:hypothetical protein HID58_007064 [Brassica napus]
MTRKSYFYMMVRLVNILEDYIPTRKQQEEDKKRYRKASGYIINNGNGSVPPTPRRSSVGKATPDLLLTPRSYSGHHRQNGYFKEVRRLTPTPLHFVAIQKEDTVSTLSQTRLSKTNFGYLFHRNLDNDVMVKKKEAKKKMKTCEYRKDATSCRVKMLSCVLPATH